MKRKFFGRTFILVAVIVLVFAFAGNALAGTDYGSWTSSTCMYGFTASDSLTKTTTNWDHFTPKPAYVRYADDGYVSDEGWIDLYVKTSGGTRMSDTCNCWKNEDDNVAIYEKANSYNTLKVRIENFEHPGQYNMRSGGNFEANYNNK